LGLAQSAPEPVDACISKSLRTAAAGGSRQEPQRHG